MELSFIFRFNNNRQWIKVFLWDIHPNTFENWGGGRWGYFQATYDNPRSGEFGELHFVKSRLRFDVVYHEIRHICVEWFWANGETVTRKNEERLISFEDKIAHKFRKALAKAEPEIKL